MSYDFVAGPSVQTIFVFGRLDIVFAPAFHLFNALSIDVTGNRIAGLLTNTRNLPVGGIETLTVAQPPETAASGDRKARLETVAYSSVYKVEGLSCGSASLGWAIFVHRFPSVFQRL